MNHNGSLRIAGYAALFDVADGARDTIREGAFARTLAERQAPLPLYWQHNSHCGASAEGILRQRSPRPRRRVAAPGDRRRSG